MSAITTHVLDVSLGRPAAGVAVRLLMRGQEDWVAIGSGVTDDDGRVGDLLEPDHAIEAGDYRLEFATGHYFADQGRDSFYPTVQIAFRVASRDEHYHVPLLLSPFGYSTYRGS